MNQTETAEMQGLIGDLKKTGLTILLIEHKLDMVMQLSDRVVVMDEGHVIAERQARRRAQRPRGDRGLSRPSPRRRVRRSRRLPNDATPLLSIEGVNTFYGPVQVHFDLSLAVGRGQIVCLLGGNASGKSTTMKIILGLVKPQSGDVRFDGQPITGLPTPQIVRRGVGSVPEARRLFGDMSVRENLLMGAFTRKDQPAIAEDLDRVLTLFPELAERLEQRAGTLSGGEQQMVAMARALMGRPKLICMDEPTMGLSPLWVDRVLDLIATINGRRHRLHGRAECEPRAARSPTTPTCCRPAASCSTARPRSSAPIRASATPISAARKRHRSSS